MLIQFEKYGISYAEKKDWHVYIGLMDVGNYYDIYVDFAKSEAKARSKFAKRKGTLVAVVSLIQVLNAMEKKQLQGLDGLFILPGKDIRV